MSGDLEMLESRVDQLIRICKKLEDENALLREKQTQIVEERARLIEKTDIARGKVDAILLRLKGLEHEV